MLNCVFFPIEELIPGIPESSTVAPPFHCDHGHGIKLGENVFINYNGTMLDGGFITIGANTQVGPNCQFLTPNHPIDYVKRLKPIERCSPIIIGEDSSTWTLSIVPLSGVWNGQPW